MTAPITASDFAKALRTLLDDVMLTAGDGDELPESWCAADALLTRYDAQQSAELADAAVEALGQRDESRYIALNKSDVRAVLRRETTQCGALVPFRVDFREKDNWEHYVPYSQLEAALALHGVGEQKHQRQILNAFRDSELLDAILEASQVGVYSPGVRLAIKNAITERAKR